MKTLVTTSLVMSQDAEVLVIVPAGMLLILLFSNVTYSRLGYFLLALETS